MRAAALLNRLPRPADTGDGTDAEKARRRRRRRRRLIRTGAGAELRLATTPVLDRAPEQTQGTTQQTDLARARRAGGPIDNASYTCACGYVFAASVSTTVACPHCGAGQAW